MPIPLRGDFDATQVRAAALHSKDAAQVRRLLALAAIYDGASRTVAARMGGVTLQIVRDWVIKFNAHGPDGLIDRKAPGQPSRLNSRLPAQTAVTSRVTRPSARSLRCRPCRTHVGATIIRPRCED